MQRYQQFNLVQRGGGLNVYRGPLVQKGYGIGSVFKRFFKWIVPIIKKDALPILKSGAKTLGEEAIKTASEVAIDALEGKNIKESVKSKIGKKTTKIKKKAALAGREIVNLSSNLANSAISGRPMKKAAETHLKKALNKIQDISVNEGQKVLDERKISSLKQLKQQAGPSEQLGHGIKRKLLEKDTIILQKKNKKRKYSDIFE